MGYIINKPFPFKPHLNSLNNTSKYPIDLLANKRQYVIPDIHGCYFTLQELLNQINLSKEDALFLLGDYIDRGTRSKEVLDLIIQLIIDDYTVFPLRGNHEQLLINRHLKTYAEEDLSLPLRPKNVELLDDHNKIKLEYFEFIANLPYYYETKDYLFSHAGFNFGSQDYLSDFDSMLWLDEMPDGGNTIRKKIITGHKNKTLTEIRNAIESNGKVISLDNGVYKRKTGMGNLVCLNLNSMQLYVQKNID